LASEDEGSEDYGPDSPAFAVRTGEGFGDSRAEIGALQQRTPQGTTRCTFQGLAPRSKWVASVAAYSALGTSPEGPASPVLRTLGPPSVEPAAPRLRARAARAVSVRWAEPELAQDDCTLNGVRIEWARVDGPLAPTRASGDLPGLAACGDSTKAAALMVGNSVPASNGMASSGAGSSGSVPAVGI